MLAETCEPIMDVAPAARKAARKIARMDMPPDRSVAWRPRCRSSNAAIRMPAKLEAVSDSAVITSLPLARSTTRKAATAAAQFSGVNSPG